MVDDCSHHVIDLILRRGVFLFLVLSPGGVLPWVVTIPYLSKDLRTVGRLHESQALPAFVVTAFDMSLRSLATRGATSVHARGRAGRGHARSRDRRPGSV